MVSNVETFTQTKADLATDRRFTARFIGNSIKDETRLNLHSALNAKYDKEDFYRFRLQRGGENMGLAISTSADIHIQLMDKRGKVIADNQGNAQTKAAFEDFQKSRLSLDKGEYYVRVERGANVKKDAVIEYYLQIQNGKYTKDYDTTEIPQSKPRASTPISTQTSANVLANLNSYVATSILSGDNVFSKMQDIYGGVKDVGSSQYQSITDLLI